MRDSVDAFLTVVPWVLIAWTAGSLIHIYFPDILIYFAPPAVFWVIAIGVNSYVTEDTGDENMALSADELE